MKFFVIGVALIAGIHANVTLPPEQSEKALKTASECIKETEVSSEVLAEAKKGNIPEDDGLKKFALCFFKKAGIVDNDGKLILETAVAKLPPGVDKVEAKKVLEGCQSKSGKTPQETAFEIYKCYHAGAKTHIALAGI